mgnify:CR=1 FL=1
MIFYSKKDWWMTLIIFGTVAMSVAAVIPLFFETLNAGTIITFLVIGLTVLLVLGIYFRTYYFVEEDIVRVVSGPFRWKVPISEITSIRATKSILSSPALSMDRLELKYGKYRYIIISPEDKNGFVGAIVKRNDKVQVNL